MDLMMRRRALMGIGGKKIPVIDIIHPDALYVKTRSNFIANYSLFAGYPSLYTNMTMFIVDGVEHSAADKDTYFALDNNAFRLKLGGEHEYYIYSTPANGYTYYYWNNPLAVVRYPRNLLTGITIQGNPYINALILVNSNLDITTTINSDTVLYVPEGATEKYANCGASEIIEVKYNFIEDIAVSRSNAPNIMNILYAANLCASTDYMTIEEAAAVTQNQFNALNFSTCDGDDFSGFKYFTKVTSIGSFTFSQRTLSAIELPTTIQTIGNNAFQYCRMLDFIIIPSSVTSIGTFSLASMNYSTFGTTIIFEGTTPPTGLNKSAILNCGTIYVPDSAISNYQAILDDYADKIKGVSEYVEQ